MRTGTIYVIKNKCNDKVYVGQTIASVKERFLQHLKPSVAKKRGKYKLYNAINKYGKENFYIEVIEDNISQEKLNELEIFYIEKFNSFLDGYNSTVGGDNKNISSISDIKLLLEMFYSGEKYVDIAKKFNVNVATIQRTISSIGLKRKLIVSEQYLIDNMNIKTNIEMSKEIGVSTATITRAFKRFGIKRGTGCSNALNKQNRPRIDVMYIEENINLPNNEIAKHLNTSVSYILRLRKKHNLYQTNKIKCIDYPDGE